MHKNRHIFMHDREIAAYTHSARAIALTLVTLDTHMHACVVADAKIVS